MTAFDEYVDSSNELFADEYKRQESDIRAIDAAVNVAVRNAGSGSPLMRLMAAAAKLNEDEITPVMMLAERIAAGRSTYGALSLDNDTRDFHDEAMAEVIDLAAYAGWTILKAKRARALKAEPGDLVAKHFANLPGVAAVFYSVDQPAVRVRVHFHHHATSGTVDFVRARVAMREALQGTPLDVQISIVPADAEPLTPYGMTRV